MINCNCGADSVSFTFDSAIDSEVFIIHLGGPPLPEGSRRNAPRQLGSHSTLFYKAANEGKTKFLKIRESALVTTQDGIFQKPTITGRLEFQPYRRRHQERLDLKIYATVHLNMNRVLNHHPYLPDDATELLRCGNPSFRSFNGDDNLANLSLCGEFHDDMRFRYVSAVIQTLMAEIDRACAHLTNLSCRVERLDDLEISLQHVETNWDLPMGRIDSLDFMTWAYPILRGHGGWRGWESNIEAITTQYCRSEYLSIYTKSNDRLRIEVRNRCTKSNRPHTFDGIDEFLAELDYYRVMAAIRVNQVLRAFHTPRIQRDGPE